MTRSPRLGLRRGLPAPRGERVGFPAGRDAPGDSADSTGRCPPKALHGDSGAFPRRSSRPGTPPPCRTMRGGAVPLPQERGDGRSGEAGRDARRGHDIVSVVAVVVHCLPQLEILVLNERVERLRERTGKLSDANEFLHVGEVLEPMRSGHARGRLEFHERGEGEQGHSRATQGHDRRVWKHNGLRLAVARAPYASRVLDSVKTEVHGDIVITYGRYVGRFKDAAPGRRTFTVWFERVYARRNGRWQYLSHRTVDGPIYEND